MNKRSIFIFSIYVIFSNVIYGQETTLKNKALEEFKKEHYDKAISLLEEAVKNDSTDAEIYYYLGWFNHYKAYDSRPLQGYDFNYSTKIFKYLDKAIKLKPDYGNAKYFYGAECSGNAFIAMQNYDNEKLKYFYSLANKKGAYPNWLKEFGRNMLAACDKNAILFTGGNADFDICTYLQLHENYRTDVSIIPIGNINRPWYVQFLKNGLQGCVRKIDMNLTDKQIMDLHPFKWKTTKVSVPISEFHKTKFNLPVNYTFQWQITPDLSSENRTFLSPQRAILLQIIEDNFYKRPIFFSNFCTTSFYGGLDKYFQNCGLVSLLTPILTQNTNYQYDYTKIEFLLQRKNLKFFKTIIQEDIPRISNVVISGYYSSLFYLLRSNKKLKKDKLKTLFEKFLQIGYDTEYEKEILEKIRS